MISAKFKDESTSNHLTRSNIKKANHDPGNKVTQVGRKRLVLQF